MMWEVLLFNVGLPTHPSATHPIQLEKGYRRSLRDGRQHMNGGWDGDRGLLVLQQDHGSFCHPKRKQEVLARRQFPQGLGEIRKEQGHEGSLGAQY